MSGERTLVIATGHALSLALFEGGRLLGAHDDDRATGQAEALVPAVAALMGGVPAARIVVEVGPGSFTGLRIGLAAAQGLALAWDAAIEGVTSSALVAAPLFERSGEECIWVALAAPRGQLWLEPVSWEGCASLGEPVSLRDPAMAHVRGEAVAGGGAAAVPGGRVIATAGPLARNWRPGLEGVPASPRYVRPADHVGA